MIFRGIAVLFVREVRDANLVDREMERAKDMLYNRQLDIINSAPHK
jgi:hypothetical protein